MTARTVLLKAEEAQRIETAQAPPMRTPELVGVGQRPSAGGYETGGAEVQRPVLVPPNTMRDAQRQTRYFGSVEINPERAVRDFGSIATEVLAHLVAQRGAKVTLRLDIDAVLPGGFPQEARPASTKPIRSFCASTLLGPKSRP